MAILAQALRSWCPDWILGQCIAGHETNCPIQIEDCMNSRSQVQFDQIRSFMAAVGVDAAAMESHFQMMIIIKGTLLLSVSMDPVPYHLSDCQAVLGAQLALRC